GAGRAAAPQLVHGGFRRYGLGVRRYPGLQHRCRPRGALVFTAGTAAHRPGPSPRRPGPHRAPAHQPGAGSVKRALTILLGALLLLLVLAAAAVVFLAATAGGTRLLAEQAERFAPI